MAGPKRCIFLTGAPDDHALDWAENRLLVDFQAPVRRFLEPARFRSTGSSTPTATATKAKWRALSSDRLNLRERQPSSPGARAPELLDRHDDDAALADRPEHFQWLEHSLAHLDSLESSQPIPTAARADADDDTDPTLTTTFISLAGTDSTDLMTTRDTTSFPSNEESSNPLHVEIKGTITDLKSLPSADHVSRIHPQTMTVHLLVGIITISPSRTVRLRRKNIEMELVEILVGDDTRAGFSITFWLSALESQAKPTDDMRGVLSELRAGDVVMLQNIALSTFRGNVYGQSLSRRFARNRTSVAVLRSRYRGSLPPILMSKFDKVREWTSNFVGIARRPSPAAAGDGAGSRKRKISELPPDTPG